ncbi:ROK family protein [Bacillus solitudinis]|uniref:ROK family protein n=1 Tax=Bacillus solitudinis TaxID=2014074 RepID=UPI000C24EBD1|nr:ROK family protein [Bacillus solitudinis]
MLGAIEAGGTKFVCAVADEDFNIIDRVSFPTTIPSETCSNVFQFFDQYELKSMGIGSFGPIEVDINSSKYGFVTDTPKKYWSNFDFLGTMKKRYNIPIFWTTDVNAAAYGEKIRGAAINSKSCLYLTVGTGIGGGMIINDQILEGFSHPEMGHILVRKHESDLFVGACPFHKDCLEGMASGKAIEERFNKKGNELSESDSFWEIEANYMAQALMSYTLTLRPEIIILGGGVMAQDHLLHSIRSQFEKLLNRYVYTPQLTSYIVSPGLKGDAGIVGALLLAEKVKQGK